MHNSVIFRIAILSLSPSHFLLDQKVTKKSRQKNASARKPNPPLAFLSTARTKRARAAHIALQKQYLTILSIQNTITNKTTVPNADQLTLLNVSAKTCLVMIARGVSFCLC